MSDVRNDDRVTIYRYVIRMIESQAQVYYTLVQRKLYVIAFSGHHYRTSVAILPTCHMYTCNLYSVDSRKK